jgi:hypothetical protein
MSQDYPSQTPETTQWAQKHFDPEYECLDPVSSVGELPMVEVPYLARGGSVPILTQWAKPEFTLFYEKCFCAHSNGLSDLEHLDGIDLAPYRVEMDVIVDGWGDACRKAMLGFFNHIGYWWGNNTGALQRNEQGRLWVDKAIARSMATASTLIQCAMTGVRDYLDEHWGIGLTRQTLTRWLDGCLSGLGIVEWAGVAGQGKKPRHWSVNLPALLLAAEACERRILADARMAGASDGEEMESLPEHQGYTLKLLFDAVFPGFGWNREGEPEEPEPRTYAETDAYQAAKPEPVARVEVSAYASTEDEQRSALSELRLAVKSCGWIDGVIEVCEMLAARWGPAWGLEAVYERVAGEVSA